MSTAVKFGPVLPFSAINGDRAAIRDFIQAVDGLGFDHLIAFDHVLVTDPMGESRGPYTHRSEFYEPMTLFAYAAGLTERLGLLSGVLLLPQRPAALVAKQAAQVDVFAGAGRLRLGVGTGMNVNEYVALGADHPNRGAVLDEQIDLMRALWSQESVMFDGHHHTVHNLGMSPRPISGSIPIWVGGMSARAIRRAAQLGDGWIPYAKATDASALVDSLHAEVEREGRDPNDVGIEPILFGHPAERPDSGAPARTLDDAVADTELWRASGVTQIGIHTMATDAADISSHIRFLERFIETQR